ncbi:hypothetical protein MKZ38_006321 [Zalerion maritima]|uniref:Uncharacterized protein n=1 Tax=Zalerion maritima TaxID=339359 RepID=A0AAD5RJ13_9PEZI|nr:hypothetical protein MKZ38_006321 [Zalerion maritima]
MIAEQYSSGCYPSLSFPPRHATSFAWSFKPQDIAVSTQAVNVVFSPSALASELANRSAYLDSHGFWWDWLFGCFLEVVLVALPFVHSETPRPTEWSKEVFQSPAIPQLDIWVPSFVFFNKIPQKDSAASLLRLGNYGQHWTPKPGLVCPGYRSAFDLKLRDETQSVIRKAKMAHRRSASDESPPPQDPSPTLAATRKRARSEAPASGISIPWVQVPYSRSGADTLNRNFRGEADLPFGVIQLGWSLDVNGNQNANSGYLTQLTTPLDQQATCFFLSNFVLSPPKGLGRGLFTFLLTLLDKPATHATPLSKSFSAVSMAALAGRPNSKTLLAKAQEYYTEAIVQLNETLRDPVKAKEDATLAAVILLAFYEILTSSDDKLVRWTSHLNGAKTLLQMRGPLESFTAEGFAMFEFVRTSMVRQYMFHQSPSPEDIKWLTSQGVIDRVGHMSIVFNLTTCVYRAEADKLLGNPSEMFMAELAASPGVSPTTSTSPSSFHMKSPLTSSHHSSPSSPVPFYQLGPVAQEARVAEVRSLMHKCIANDRQLGAWLSKCPPRWRATQSYVAGYVPDSELGASVTFPGPVLDFPNVWVAAKILIVHASRLVLSGLIMRSRRWLEENAPALKTNPVSPAPLQDGQPLLGPEQDVSYEGLRDTAHTEILAILSAIPYFCSWCGDRATTPYFPCGTPEKPKGYAGISSIWPIFVAGACEFSEERERIYLRGRLRSISDTMGIRHAETFAQCMQRREYVPHLKDHEVMPGMTPYAGFTGSYSDSHSVEEFPGMSSFQQPCMG